jgi:hypothetical protein
MAFDCQSDMSSGFTRLRFVKLRRGKEKPLSSSGFWDGSKTELSFPLVFWVFSSIHTDSPIIYETNPPSSFWNPLIL